MHPTQHDSSTVAVDLALTLTRLRARMRLETAGATTGWTISQLSALGRIVSDGPITASELAQLEYVRAQSVAETVASLKAAGLVASRPDPRDRRKTLLSATEAGSALAASISKSRGAWLSQVIDQVVRPDERDVLVAGIDILRRLAECDLSAPDADGWRI